MKNNLKRVYVDGLNVIELLAKNTFDFTIYLPDDAMLLRRLDDFEWGMDATGFVSTKTDAGKLLFLNTFVEIAISYGYSVLEKYITYGERQKIVSDCIPVNQVDTNYSSWDSCDEKKELFKSMYNFD